MTNHTHISGITPRRNSWAAVVLAAIALALTLGPARALSTGDRAASAGSYQWPVKPFNRQHPVRGSFADPRTVFKASPTLRGALTGRGTFSLHRGIDIAAPDGSAVYPVSSGTVTYVNGEWLKVESGVGHTFEYWHIRAAVTVGSHVDAYETVLGHISWVAANGVAQILPDAARDPRAETIPGTEDDLEESMLLAPMTFDDVVLGVLVLSKLGLDQFSEDDLRLLEIYASLAAQAFANADSTELLRERTAALERQLRNQGELLQITESILTTLDPVAVLDQITDRLGNLVHYDNISIEIYDRRLNVLTPLTARGVNADDYLQPWEPGETGLATWVLQHNEPQLVVDELADRRVLQFDSTGPVDGSLIVVPLRGREGVAGVLTLERLGRQDRFNEEEFALVKLFAAQVSIALHNAEIHLAVEIRARSDGLTGLLNHATFQEFLVQRVREATPFSLIMLDLDEFRTINNQFGHQAGDRLLRAIADALLHAGRDTDQVFRYGGDEFAFLLPGTDGAGALRVAERARDAVRQVGEQPAWKAAGMLVSASIGVATFPIDGEAAEDVLLAADRACYVAKRTGTGRIATAAEGLELAAEVALQEPTPVDPPSLEILRD